MDLRFTDPKGKWQHLSLVASLIDEDELSGGVGFVGSSFAEALPVARIVDPVLGVVYLADFLVRLWIDRRPLVMLASPVGLAEIAAIVSFLAPTFGGAAGFAAGLHVRHADRRGGKAGVQDRAGLVGHLAQSLARPERGLGAAGGRAGHVRCERVDHLSSAADGEMHVRELGLA